ncbi:MAG: bifunctional oligoribonuclease/PAP phosphatase NrnA [Clostridiaceae bacterium]|nr:bifunctional oligoribonuclease/PAP phosphatase NrnA [Clostridiaceae bacterium]
MLKIGNLDYIFDVLLGLEPQHIVVLPHVRTDPDALGSVAALTDFLKQLKHKVEIVVDEEPNKKLEFIYEHSALTVFSDEYLAKMKTPDLLIFIDHHSINRLNHREKIIHKYSQVDILIIDHHLIEAKTKAEFIQQAEFANRNVYAWIDPARSAVSEMIAELFLKAQATIGETISLKRNNSISLLAGIYGDTGGLRFSNTSAHCFYICSQLMRSDISIDKIVEPIFGNKSLRQIRLVAKIFEDASLNEAGNIIWYGVTQKFLAENHGTQDDLEGVCSDLREIENIDLALLFREISENEIRVNLRSNENFDASILARHFDGGGHARASGITFRGNADLQEIITKVIKKANELMKVEPTN